jgi:ATP-dependent exoDNAse (exonuclease V) alpha subunit
MLVEPESPLVSANQEAVEAVNHVLLGEVVRGIASLSGKDVMVFAPSSSAVEVLKQEGLSASETVQGLMKNPFLQDIAKGKVLLVDEAGFLSAKQMHWIVKFASQSDCRLILSGDTRQHHSVERGDSLRVLENLGALKPARLRSSGRTAKTF